jgi:hypothetical protein
MQPAMQPAIVMPMHDPQGLIFPHIKAVTPLLKTIFAQAFVSVPASTKKAQPAHVDWLETEGFFQVLHHEDELPVGDTFSALYTGAAITCNRQQVLHLCFPDRVAFALHTEHRDSFIADMRTTTLEQTPLIFQRSEAAWNTHPRNYRQIEQMVTTVGQILFQKTLDFAWCHFAIRVGQAREILPQIKAHDLSLEAEIVLLLKDIVQTREVDWLAWEDPFIFGSEPEPLRREREQSAEETRKRLSYVLPMLQLLYATIA